MKTDIFDHRLSGHKSENINALALTDAVCIMTNRALGVLSLIEQEFESGDENRLTNKVILSVFDSIEMEVRDVNELVSHYHDVVSGRTETSQEEQENE